MNVPFGAFGEMHTKGREREREREREGGEERLREKTREFNITGET